MEIKWIICLQCQVKILLWVKQQKGWLRKMISGNHTLAGTIMETSIPVALHSIQRRQPHVPVPSKKKPRAVPRQHETEKRAVYRTGQVSKTQNPYISCQLFSIDTPRRLAFQAYHTIYFLSIPPGGLHFRPITCRLPPQNHMNRR